MLIGDASSGCASRVGGELACERGAAVEDLPSVAGSGDKGGAVQHLEVLVWGAGSQPFSLRTRAAPPSAVSGIYDGGRYSAMGGGVPLTHEGQVIAGVGVSGGTTDQDIAIVEGAMS